MLNIVNQPSTLKYNVKINNHTLQTNVMSFLSSQRDKLKYQLEQANEKVALYESKVQTPAFLINQLSSIFTTLDFCHHAQDLCELLGAALRNTTGDQKVSRDDRNILELHKALNDELDSAVDEMESVGCNREKFCDPYADEKIIDNAERVKGVRGYLNNNM